MCPSPAIATASAGVVALAVANRVLHKLALVPLKVYPFFLTQLTTFGYVAVYFSILYARYRAGVVTRDVLAGAAQAPVRPIGLLEALGVASGMSAGAMLPGPAACYSYTVPVFPGVAAYLLCPVFGKDILNEANHWLLPCNFRCD